MHCAQWIIKRFTRIHQPARPMLSACRPQGRGPCPRKTTASLICAPSRCLTDTLAVCLPARVVSILIFHVCLAKLRIRRLIRLRCQCKSHLIYRAGRARLPTCQLHAGWQHISSRSRNVDIKWIKNQKKRAAKTIKKKRENEKRKWESAKSINIFRFCALPSAACIFNLFAFAHWNAAQIYTPTGTRPWTQINDNLCARSTHACHFYTRHIHIHTYTIFSAPRCSLGRRGTRQGEWTNKIKILNEF